MSKLAIKVKEATEPKTRVWFGIEQDEDGEFQETLAVFVDDIHNGRVSVYSPVGQHSEADIDYVRGLYACTHPKSDALYNELKGLGYDLEVINTNAAEQVLGTMFPDGNQREDEDPSEFDVYESKKGESKFKCSMAKKKESLAKKSEANNDWVAYYFCKDPKGYEWAVMPHQVIGNGANVGCVNDRGGLDYIGLKYALEECEPLNQSLESSKIYKAVSDGEDRTIIPLTLADATRIANAGNDKLAVLGIIADMHFRKSESKKSEATYDRPVSLYITTRYDDAEEAQNFIKDMVGEELTVSKYRNGDALYVSIEGSDDAIDAFLEVYNDEYENILNDCDVDANGWVSPDDTYYSSIEGRKELMGESTKK
jgi:hypothetical protein